MNIQGQAATSVLVTDAESRAALAVARSLGRSGHEVHLCSPAQRPLAGASRFAHAVHRVVSALEDAEGFCAQVEAIARATGVQYVLPVADPSCTVLLPRRERLRPVTVLGPPSESYLTASDKVRLLAMARECNMAIPAQWELLAPGAPIPDHLQFPIVVKPHRSANGGYSLLVRHAKDAVALDAVLASLPRAAYPVLLQQRIIGPGTGVFVLRLHGCNVLMFAHCRLVEQPPSGGGSVYCESIPVDPVLAAGVELLLARLEWEGPAMIEFKRDESTGVAYVMEMNGRFWGSLQLAIDAGADFPAVWIADALGERLREAPPPYRVGVRLRSFTGLADHLLDRLRHSSERLSLPPNAPPLLWVARKLLWWSPSDRFESLRLGDPAPFLRDVAMLATRRIRNVLS